MNILRKTYITIIFLLVTFCFPLNLMAGTEGPQDVLQETLSAPLNIDSADLRRGVQDYIKTNKNNTEFAKNLFGPVDYHKYEAIRDYYRQEAYSDRMATARKVADILKQAPMLTEVYGIGFPFYGNVDITKRIALTLDRVKNGEISKKEFLRRITPDLDMLIVVRDNDNGPWAINEDMYYELKNRLVNYVADRQWGKINRQLQANSRLGDLYAEREYALELFVYEGKLLLDIVYVPEHVWNDVPVFIEDGDSKYFHFLRDILFSLENNFGNTSKVPEEFLHNYFLNRIASREVSEKELTNEFINEHVYKDLIEMFSASRKIVVEKMKSALALAERRGFITRKGDMLALTASGKDYLKSVLDWRLQLIEKGYDFDGLSAMSKQQEWMDKASAFSIAKDDAAGKTDMAEVLISPGCRAIGQAI